MISIKLLLYLWYIIRFLIQEKPNVKLYIPPAWGILKSERILKRTLYDSKKNNFGQGEGVHCSR